MRANVWRSSASSHKAIDRSHCLGRGGLPARPPAGAPALSPALVRAPPPHLMPFLGLTALAEHGCRVGKGVRIDPCRRFAQPCHKLLRRLALTVQGQPKVPYENCTVPQIWGGPSFMLFDGEGTTVGGMTCHGKKITSYSGDVHINDALFTLRLFSHILRVLDHPTFGLTG
jgi:hypothetical protein